MESIVKRTAQILLLLAGIVALVLGIHGMYVHFSDVALFGVDEVGSKYAGDLFLALDVPDKLDGVVEWFSIKGIEVWLVPFSFIIVGVILEYLQSNIYRGSTGHGFTRGSASGVIQCHAKSRAYIPWRKN